MFRRPERYSLTVPLPLLILLVLLAGCNPPTYRTADPRLNRLPLQTWVAFHQDARGTVQPCVQAAVPYRSLVFHSTPDGLVSGLEVQVTAWRGEEPAGGGVASARITLPDVAATRDRGELAVRVPLHVRGQEPVRLEVLVHVLDTARRWERELTYAPRAFQAMPLWLRSVTTDLAPSAQGELLVPADRDSLTLTAVLARRHRGLERPFDQLELLTEATGPGQETARQQRTPVPALAASADSLVLRQVWSTRDLPFGRCRLEVALQTTVDGATLRLPSEPALVLLSLSLDLASDESWQHHLDWLEGRLSASVRDSLGSLPPTVRDRAWRDLWSAIAREERCEPAVCAQDHLLRIVTADDRFGDGVRGALSDRGRVFVQYGEPAQVDSHADDRMPGAIWEVWTYPALGLRFYFYDAHGLGDFRLRRQEPLADRP
jgi:GWxTD domain-containing protein